MDEEEYQRIVNGAAGALADTWKKTSDFLGSWNSPTKTTIDERYQSQEGFHWMTPSQQFNYWIQNNPESAKNLLNIGMGAAAGGGSFPLQLLGGLGYVQENAPDWLSEWGFTPEYAPFEGKGESSGDGVPTFVPYDAGEFEYGHWTEGLGEPNPEIGGGYGVLGNPHLDYYNLRQEAVEKGLYPEYSGPEFGGSGTWNTPPEYNVWASNATPVIHDEEERKWQLEYDAAREAFDRRNDEEERRHREEYDKMVADILLEESMDTDFSMGDLEPDDFWTKLETFLDSTVYNPIFDAPPDDTGTVPDNTDGWNEPAESTPPSWLTVD